MMWAYIDPGTGFTIFSVGGWIAALFAGLFGFLILSFKKILKYFKNRKRFVIIIILIILTIFLTAKMIMQKQEVPFNRKIIILGFDGLSPEILEPMMNEGKLPHFKTLKDKGSYRHLKTTNPSQSPVAWSGFMTGQNPGKHGIYDFVIRDPKTYALELSLSHIENNRAKSVLKTKSFWWYSSKKRIPAVILGCPMTFPAEAMYGKMISGMGVPDILGTEGTFTFYTSEELNTQRSMGGKVFHVNRSPLMVMHLIGPRVAGLLGATENTKVPFKVTLNEQNKNITIEYQGHTCTLKEGEWSPWQSVVFDAGPLKKIYGIFKFYLIKTAPVFQLYISPINFDPRHPLFPISYPPEYARELTEQIGLYHTQGMPMDTWAVNESRMDEKSFLQNTDELFKETKAISDLELNRFDRGIYFSYFEFPDIIQHMFWRYIDPKHPLYDKHSPLEYKMMIEKWYQKMDNILGEAMAKVGRDDTLIVLSDHGFNTFRRAVHINRWLKDQGYLVLTEPYALEGEELLKNIDWPKTKAYAIGFGAIYINQKGREAKGIVTPGEETERLKEEIVQKLNRWMDDKYRTAIIHHVYKKEDIFWGDDTKDMPDLYVGFNIGYEASWQTALGGVPQSLIEDNLKKWSGSHLFDPALIPGVFFSNRQITQEHPSIYDIAPTILKEIGYSSEELKKFNMDGVPLFQ